MTVYPFPSEEQIRLAAYYRFLERRRSGGSGDAVSDWLEAEQASITVEATAPRVDPDRGVVYAEAPEDADDLSALKGVGAKMVEKLNDLGVFRFAQIAAWTPETIASFGKRIGNSKRIEREDWVGQARKLVAKGETSAA